MNLRKIALILICLGVQPTKAIDPTALQPTISPAVVDKAVIDAYEHARLETEILSGKTINQNIEFSLIPTQDEKQGTLFLRTYINLEELETASEKTPEEKNSLRALLLKLFREKLETEEKNTIQLGNKTVLVVGQSPRMYRSLGELTQCHVSVTDVFNDCLECKMFIDSLKYQQLKSTIKENK